MIGSCISQRFCRKAAPLCRRNCGELGHRFCIQDGKHGSLRFYPDGVSRAEGLAAAGDFRIHADVEADRAFNGLDNAGNGGGTVCGQNLKPTELSATRRGKTSSAKGLKNLGEKAFRSADGARQFRL